MSVNDREPETEETKRKRNSRDRKKEANALEIAKCTKRKEK